mgnify:CR=1 FL=1
MILIYIHLLPDDEMFIPKIFIDILQHEINMSIE